MDESSPLASDEWLIKAIGALPSDDPVPLKTPGYNKYTNSCSTGIRHITFTLIVVCCVAVAVHQLTL